MKVTRWEFRVYAVGLFLESNRVNAELPTCYLKRFGKANNSFSQRKPL